MNRLARGRELARRHSKVLYYAAAIVTVLATLTLFLIALRTGLSIPYSGLTWKSQGSEAIIAAIEVRGPAARAGLEVGDRLVTLESSTAPVRDLSLSQYVPGDRLQLEVARGDRTLTVELALEEWPPAEWLALLLPLVVALIFWLVGGGIWLLRPHERTSLLFVGASQLAALLLATGHLNSIGNPRFAAVFSWGLLLVAPVTLHFFLSLFESSIRLADRRFVSALYGIALLIAVLLTPIAARVLPPAALLALRWLRDLYVVAVLAAAMVVLFRATQDVSLRVQRRSRLLVVGQVLGLGPLLGLALLPNVLWGRPAVEFTWTLPFLTLIPLSYGYALVRGDLGRVDYLLNRTLVSSLLTIVLVASFSLLLSLLGKIVPEADLGYTISAVVLALGAIVVVGPLRGWLQRSVDQLLYGGWYDYRTIVRRASRGLSRTIDLGRLSEQLLDIARTMRFESAAILWERDALLEPRDAFGLTPVEALRLRLPNSEALADHLTRARVPLTTQELLAGFPVSPVGVNGNADSLPLEGLWLPMVSRGVLHGLLFLGPRQAESELDDDDRDILITLGSQSAIAADNIALVESLRQRLSEVEEVRDALTEAHRGLAEGREQERLRLAQELHDGPLQDMYGIQYQLEALRRALGSPEHSRRIESTQEQMEEIADRIRQLCGELRPPTLTPFGLETAIRAYAEQFAASHPTIQIHLDLAYDGQRIPEAARLALFRIVQQALANIARHAAASQVTIRFLLALDELYLEVKDDGCGFEVPASWLTFAREGHFGLLGAAERASALGGRLAVRSTPGQGTVLRVVAPLQSQVLSEVAS